MIGVIANLSEHGVIREFFELFKTPWEFYRSDRRYDVLLCAGDAPFPPTAAKLVIVYASSKTLADTEVEIDSQRRSTLLSYKGGRIPVYEGSITFRHKGCGILTDEIFHESAGYLQQSTAARWPELAMTCSARSTLCSPWVSQLLTPAYRHWICISLFCGISSSDPGSP